MLEAILFDLDGTLADTDPLHFLIWQEFLRDYGYEIDRDFYKQRISGGHNPHILADLLPQLSPAEAERFAWEKEALFRDRAAELPRMPGLSEFLDWIGDRTFQRNLKTGVVTNAPPENARFMLSTLGLEARFDTVVMPTDVANKKPHPEPYQTALQRLGVRPERAIAFEDSPSGVRSAVAAGIFTFGVTSTQTPEFLRERGASLAIADFQDPHLWEWLQAQKTGIASPS